MNLVFHMKLPLGHLKAQAEKVLFLGTYCRFVFTYFKQERQCQGCIEWGGGMPPSHFGADNDSCAATGPWG